MFQKCSEPNCVFFSVHFFWIDFSDRKGNRGFAVGRYVVCLVK